MKSRALLGGAVCAVLASIARGQQMQVGFLWHMHQPIYYPGETINQTEGAGHFSYSVYDVLNQRFGPYTSWPKDAIASGLGLPDLGASVSFSGSLIENLNNMQAAGVNGGMWNNWNSSYSTARTWNTQQGNPRLDLVGFNYNHALLPLLDVRDMKMQIEMQKVITQQTFGSSIAYSTGFFPAETAFSERMIPVLQSEGFQWSLVDNIHFDRATQNYPQTNASGSVRAEQGGPDQPGPGGRRRRVGPAQQRLGTEQGERTVFVSAAQCPIRRSEHGQRQQDRRGARRALRGQRRRPGRIRGAAL